MQDRRRRARDRRDDAARRRRVVRRGEAARFPALAAARRGHRRPPGAQHGHDRRLDRQQRSGGRLAGGARRRSTRPSSPTSARSPPTTSSRACTRPRSAPTRSSRRCRFPVPKKAAYVKFPNPASRFALVGVFVAQLADGSVRVAVTGAGPSVFRAAGIESALAKTFHGRRREGGEGRRQRAQQRPARLRRVSRAPRRGDGVARGCGDLAHRHADAAVVGLAPAASGAQSIQRTLSNATHV